MCKKIPESVTTETYTIFKIIYLGFTELTQNQIQFLIYSVNIWDQIVITKVEL